MKRISIVILFIILCALGSVFLVACDNEKEHEHIYGEWTTIKQPTCTSVGNEKATCEICGKNIYRSIEKLKHDYSDTPITFKEATCEEEGELHYECKNGCGIPKIEFTPRFDHDYSSDEVIKPATCTEKGERRVRCVNCSKEKVTVLSALGHKYDEEGSVVTKATCETDGLRKFTCERCKKEITEPIKAFGHVYGGFVVDKPSTLNDDGQKSRHCTRAGYNSVIDKTTIPKGEYVEYTVSVKRKNGKEYPFTSELSVSIIGSNDEGNYKFVNGKATFKAKADENLGVKINGLRNGYTQKTDAKLGRSEVELDLVVEGAIVEGASAPDHELRENEAMYDFTVFDPNKNTNKKLSELIKGKKGAYVYFFYVGCGACSSQFPVFANEYNKYANKDEILVVMVNIYPESRQGQTAADMLQYKKSKNYPDEIYMTSGVYDGINVFNWVSRPYDGVPFSYFLDSEGIIDEIVEANSASALRDKYSDILSRYIGEKNEDSDNTARNYVHKLSNIAAKVEVAESKRQIYGRYNISFNDINKLVYPVSCHRIKLDFEAVAENITPDELITMILDKTKGEIENRSNTASTVRIEKAESELRKKPREKEKNKRKGFLGMIGKGDFCMEE